MLTANYEYFRSNRENLLLPIQILFFQFFIVFLESTLTFEYYKKKNEPPHSSSISEAIDSERLAYLNA